MREDINHFNIVDSRELVARRNQKRRRLIYNFDRCSYQVAVASMSGFSIQGQNFAAAHRIPLIEFDKMPFWEKFCQQARFSLEDTLSQEDITEEDIVQTANQIGSHMVVYYREQGLPTIKMISISQGFLAEARAHLK